MCRHSDRGQATNLTDAILIRTDLRGVDLCDVIGLERAQIDQAIIDEKTTLPDYLGNMSHGRRQWHSSTGTRTV